MSDETIEDAMEMIFRYGIPYPTETMTEDGGVRRTSATSVRFFGGEPLLAFDKVKRFMRIAEERNMKLGYILFTNGTVGTQEMADYLKEHNVKMVRSIDGSPEVQEKYRPNSIEAYRQMTKIFKDYNSGRLMTVQPEFAKDIFESLVWFEEEGFKFGGTQQPNYYAAWSDKHIDDFAKSMWRITEEYLKRWKEGRPFYNFFLSREMAYRFSVPLEKSQVGCDAGKTVYSIAWDGYIYLCHRFTRDPHDSDACYGHIKDALAGTARGFGRPIRDYIDLDNKRVLYPECKSCVAIFSCRKGCMHNNIKCTGDYRKPPKLYCAIRQEVAKMVTYLDMKLRTIDPDWWVRGNSNEMAVMYMKNKKKRAAQKV